MCVYLRVRLYVCNVHMPALRCVYVYVRRYVCVVNNSSYRVCLQNDYICENDAKSYRSHWQQHKYIYIYFYDYNDNSKQGRHHGVLGAGASSSTTVRAAGPTCSHLPTPAQNPPDPPKGPLQTRHDGFVSE